MNQKEYIGFARAMQRACVVKRNGTLSYRHRWPEGQYGSFLSKGLLGLQARAEGRMTSSKGGTAEQEEMETFLVNKK